MDIKNISLSIIKWGIKKKVQDIYVLPIQEKFQIFIRKGNQRLIYQELDRVNGEKLILHFKFMGHMDVSEKRRAQVGSTTYKLEDITIRLRLSTVGDYRFRESLVIRFLHLFGIAEENYFFPTHLLTIQQNIKKRGLYLFCGPVGSGKTTLMYKLAKERGGAKQIITIEDPVEIEEVNFLQLQTNNKINLTYDTLIKACLRHHLDIVIIGEIRDEVTARAAIRAALTGHTVFRQFIQGILLVHISG